MTQPAPPLRPVSRNRPVLAEAVTRELVHDVVTERYAAGTALPSTVALCETFAVSRTVVREAITALTEKGLVAARQGLRDLAHALEARAAREEGAQARLELRVAPARQVGEPARLVTRGLGLRLRLGRRRANRAGRAASHH